MSSRLASLVASVALVAALAVIPPAAALAGGGCHGDSVAVHTGADTNLVSMDSCAFLPTIARVPVGAEVRFLNKSDVTHIVAGEPGEWGQSRELTAAQDFRRRFDRPGIYPYSCPLHPGMVGAIVVGDAATTDAAAPDVAAPAPTPTVALDVAAAPVAATEDAGFGAGTLLVVGLAGIVAGFGIAGVIAARRRTTG